MVGESRSIDASKVLNLLQSVVLLTTVGAVFMSVGMSKQTLEQNSRSIDELQEIASDLVTFQVLSAANDEKHVGMLTDLARRLEKLEDRD
mgnify:CR=1 FL=1